MRNVFGGRLTGEKASKTSSRYFQTPTYMIGGIQVPSKPVEPDNCCMSGCVNCVWELFNDDLKEYKAQRKLAAESLRAHGGVWPLKYNPPVSMLNMENLPEEIRNKSPQEIDEIISDQQYYDNSDRWESVLMSAFADFERKLHKEHETRQRN